MEPDAKRAKLESKSLREIDVGITEYLSKNEKLQGILKERFSDFIVKEIHKDTIVELKSTEVVNEVTTEENALSEDLCKQLEELVENESGEVSIPVPEDKNSRKAIHESIRRLFPSLESSTGEEDGQKVILVKFSTVSSQMRERWPKNRPPYCRFTLYKENIDTMDCLLQISKILHLNAKLFTYAGTKDKRAITTQYVTAHKVRAKKLARINRVKNPCPGTIFKVGDYEYVEKPLALGDSSGNHFTIFLRNLNATEDVVNSNLSNLKENGFINYFGLQRFGTGAVPTYAIGKALLKGEWEEAVNLILTPKKLRHFSEETNEIMKAWETDRDAEGVLKQLKSGSQKLRNAYNIEMCLLEALLKFGNTSFLKALQALPKNVQLIYLHSYQSLIWNLVASKRYQQFGRKVVEGDLCSVGTKVLVKDENLNCELKDVVLPMPGSNVKLPENEIATLYKQLLESDGISIEKLSMNKHFYLPGAYRRVFMDLSDLNWKYFTYESDGSDFKNLDEIKPGDKQGLKLEFSLPPSCYATMVLREILQIDTSPANQTMLSKGLFSENDAKHEN